MIGKCSSLNLESSGSPWCGTPNGNLKKWRTLMRVSTYFVVGIMIASSTVVFAADVQSRPGEKTEDRAVARQCLKDLQAFDEKLAETGFGFLPPGGYGSTARSGYYVWGVEETPRQKIRSLHNAAYVYARGGDEQSCQMVLASMRQVYEQHQKPVGIEADDPNVRLAWRRETGANRGSRA